MPPCVRRRDGGSGCSRGHRERRASAVAPCLRAGEAGRGHDGGWGPPQVFGRGTEVGGLRRGVG